MVWSFFERQRRNSASSGKPERRRKRPRTAVLDRAPAGEMLGGESLESRAMLAVANLAGNDLQIDFTETGTNSEAVTIAISGGNYVLEE